MLLLKLNRKEKTVAIRNNGCRTNRINFQDSPLSLQGQKHIGELLKFRLSFLVSFLLCFWLCAGILIDQLVYARHGVHRWISVVGCVCYHQPNY